MRLNDEPEIDRDAIVEMVRLQTLARMEEFLPGSSRSPAGLAAIERFMATPGFQVLVTRCAAELEAQLKGQVH